MTLQIQEGKYYKGTDGQKYGPMLHEGVGELNHPWYQEGSGLVWFSDGTSSFEPHLVAEWKDAEDMTHEDTPKCWKDMTDEEKGALLLAHHEGKTIEFTGDCGPEAVWFEDEPKWFYNLAYRVKPAPKEPKREAVTLIGGFKEGWEFDVKKEAVVQRTHKITFDLIDGVPDCDSVTMEKL